MRLIIALLFVAGTLCASAQIKVNSPYQKKDESYIPDGDESDGTESPATPAPIPGAPTSTYGQEANVQAVIESLFTAMYNANSYQAKSLFLPEGRIISKDTDGSVRVLTSEQFSAMLGNLARGRYREEIKDIEIKIDDYLASAWVDYELYVDGKYDHCGVDAFQLHYDGSSWKILQIADTRRDDCTPMGEAGVINNLLDNWHLAASNANAADYFDDLDKDATYLGTDPSENWDKQSFYQFARPFFDKGSAWDFKAKERDVTISEDGNTAWFNELLDTWMGPCRGSGVLSRDQNGIWKIKQYNLAVLVPNEKIQDYIRLIK